MRTFAAAWRGRSLVLCAVVLAGLLGAQAAAREFVQVPARPLPFPAQDLLDDLKTLSADAMEGREFGTPGGARARAYIVERLKAIGFRPTEQAVELPARGGRPARRGANVIATVPGRTDPSRYLIVSAHYDHIGVRSGIVYNGANDNASGAAAMLTLAAYFKAHPTEASLLFVAFDGEELGLVGSRTFVRSPPVPKASILIDLNADMIGRDPNNTLFVSGTVRQPALRPFIDQLAARSPVRLRVGHENPRDMSDDWTRDSDQFAFLEAGIPALYFGVEDFDQQHQPTDDFETMTQAFYVRAVETLVAAVEAFDAGRAALRR